MGLVKTEQSGKSVFYSWILSYTVILAVCIIISGIAYSRSLHVIESEINKSNAAMLKQVQIILDGYIRDIYNLSNTIAVNPKVTNFINRERPFNESDLYDLLEINRDCRIYKLGNSFIDSLYIYYKRSDTGISSDGSFNGKMLYDSLQLGNTQSYDDFLKFLSQRHTNSIFTLSRANVIGEGGKTAIYAQSLPLTDTLLPNANIIIFLNGVRFQEIIRNVKLENVENVLVLGSDNTIVGSAQPVTLSEQLNYEKLAGSNGRVQQVYDGKKFVVSYVQSQICGWKYISMIPASVFEEKVSDVRWFIVVSIAVCLLLGGFLAYYFTRRNYNPINELVRTFAAKTGGGAYKKGYNEFEFIIGSFHRTYEEKESIQKRLVQNHDVLRASLLTRLLKGRMGNKVSLDDTLSYLNIRFMSDRFAVILFSFADYGELVSVDEDKQSEDELKLIHFVLTNVVEELVGQNHQGFVTEMDTMMACLVNFKHTDTEGCMQELVRIVNDAQQFLQNQFNITMTIAISNIHGTLAGISQAYMEALEALEYKLVMGSTAIIQYESIKNTTGNTVSYNYSLETEQKLINFVKVSDFDGAQALLNEVFNNNLRYDSLAVGMIKCLMVDLVCTMIKTMDEIGGSTDKAFFEKLNPIEQLLKYETVDEMKNLMLKVLKSFCCYNGEKKKSHNVKLKQELLQFLNENYHKAEMNIEMVAARFEMNPVYISRFFKEQMGESMLDYLNKMRLERAKQLLISDEKENIGDIALKAGFYNHGTFIRIFKKYEGIIPKRYVEMMKLKK